MTGVNIMSFTILNKHELKQLKNIDPDERNKVDHLILSIRMSDKNFQQILDILSLFPNIKELDIGKERFGGWNKYDFIVRRNLDKLFDFCRDVELVELHFKNIYFDLDDLREYINTTYLKKVTYGMGPGMEHVLFGKDVSKREIPIKSRTKSAMKR